VIIINNKKLTARRKHMTSLMNMLNVTNYIFLDEVSLDFADRANDIFSSDLQRFRMIQNATLRSESQLEAIAAVTMCSASEKSLAISHYLSWAAIASASWIRNAVVLEDDVFQIEGKDIVDAFNNYVTRIEKTLSYTAWILYPGVGKGFPIPAADLRRFDGDLLINDHHQSVYSDSYILNKKAAASLCSSILPFSTSVDWQMTWGSKFSNITTFYAAEPVTRQASENEFKSSIKHT